MDPYIIIFAALAVVACLCLYSVLGQRTGSERPFRVSAFTYRLSMIASVLCAVHYVAYSAKWYAAIAARVTPISGSARDTVIALLAMALLLGAALVLSFLQWKDWKAQKLAFEHAGIDQDGAVIAEHAERQRARGGGVDPQYLKKAKPLDGLLRDHPSQRKADDQKADRVDPRIEREFNNVFMTLSKERKQALIKRWMDRKKCDREEAMRLAIEELRRDNR